MINISSSAPRLQVLLILIILALITILTAFPSRTTANTQATVMVSPPVSRPDSPGTWTLTLTAGSGGLPRGAGLKTRLPFDYWQPGAPQIVYAATSQPGVQAEVVALRPHDPELPWQYVRDSPVVEVRLVQGNLPPGGQIIIQFGDASGDTIRSPESAHTAAMPVALDAAGRGVFADLQPFPQLTVTGGSPVQARALLPSVAVAGRPVTLRLTLLDRFGNALLDPDASVTLRSSDAAQLPQGTLPSVGHNNRSWEIPVTWRTTGLHQLEVTLLAFGQVYETTSNPVRVITHEPAFVTYFGDLHSHGPMSHDAYGSDLFAYARDVAGLDFYARTDHSSADLRIENGLTDEEWALTKETVRDFHAPGRFVTLLGYEYSASPPSGHVNVYFDAADAQLDAIPLFRRVTHEDIPSLYSMLEDALPPDVSAITIPHHTGICWGPRYCSTVDFQPPYSDLVLRPALEIISDHGQSERFDPSHPLAYEQGEHGARSAPGPHYAQDAWAAGHALGAVGGSDDHSGHPGMTVLTAVLAPDLSRDAVLEAIRARRTYAVTGGQRILIDFTLNGRPIGEQVPLLRGQPALLELNINGTGPLENVELLAWDFGDPQYDADGRPRFQIVAQWQPQTRDFQTQLLDSSISGAGLYYVRLQQSGPLVDGLRPAALTSPIWVNRTMETATFLPALASP